MRAVTLLAVFLFLPVVTSHAEEIFRVTLKNGNILTWKNYQEQVNQDCTEKSFGMFCLDKKDVVSVKKEDDNPTGADVIYNAVSPEEKAEAEKSYKESAKLQKGYEKERECKELDERIRSIASQANFSDPFGSLSPAVDAAILRKQYNAKCLTPKQQQQVRESDQRFEDFQRNQKIDNINQKINDIDLREMMR
ncbi:MAG: hypothetical protein ABSA46_08545 [Thermodesulfovibrionales bacterium]